MFNSTPFQKAYLKMDVFWWIEFVTHAVFDYAHGIWEIFRSQIIMYQIDEDYEMLQYTKISTIKGTLLQTKSH